MWLDFQMVPTLRMHSSPDTKALEASERPSTELIVRHGGERPEAPQYRVRVKLARKLARDRGKWSKFVHGATLPL